MSLDIMRHREIFDPDWMEGKKVTIIGCGATGSAVGLSLARLGVHHIDLWDYDQIEAHNIANQQFFQSDLGKFKVSNLRSYMTNIHLGQYAAFERAHDGTSPLQQIVFLLVDSMKARKEIWNNGIKMKGKVKLMIETRLDPLAGRVYTVDPNQLRHVKAWEAATAYADEDVPVSACGHYSTVGPTAMIVANMAVIQFMRWVRMHAKKTVQPIENELIIGMDDFFVARQIW